MKAKSILSAAGLCVALVFSPLAGAADAAAAQALAKKEGCLKCHAVDKKKDSASIKDIAKKFAGKPDGEDKVLSQITTGAKVKLEDGTEEENKMLKTKDKAEVDNLITCILSLK